jgi:hypothetical protein
MNELIDTIHSDALTYTERMLQLQPVFVGWEGVEDDLSLMSPPARYLDAHVLLVEGVANLRAAGQDLHQAVVAGSDARVDSALDIMDLAVD